MFAGVCVQGVCVMGCYLGDTHVVALGVSLPVNTHPLTLHMKPVVEIKTGVGQCLWSVWSHLHLPRGVGGVMQILGPDEVILAEKPELIPVFVLLLAHSRRVSQQTWTWYCFSSVATQGHGSLGRHTSRL